MASNTLNRSTNHPEGDSIMSLDPKHTATLEALYAAIGAALGKDVAPASTTTKKAPAAKTTAEPVPADPTKERRAELAPKTVVALRKIAIALGFDADDVKAITDKDELIDAIIEGESEVVDDTDDDDADDEDVDGDDTDTDDDGDDDSEDEDDEEGDDEEDADDRDTLAAMDLRNLRKHVLEYYEVDAAAVKTAKKDEILDMIFPDDDEEADDDADEEDIEDDDADDAEDDDAEDDEDDEDEDEDDALSEEDLNEMSVAQLKAVIKEYGGKAPVGAVKKPALIKIIMDLADVEF